MIQADPFIGYISSAILPNATGLTMGDIWLILPVLTGVSQKK
jgi:hypothetical protein